jgi:hypothetical protein
VHVLINTTKPQEYYTTRNISGSTDVDNTIK